MVLAVIIGLVIVASVLIFKVVQLKKQNSTDNSITASPNTIISFKTGYELTDLPVVTFYQGSNKYHFILDTGCSRSALNPAMLEKLQYIDTPHTNNYFGVDGHSIKSGIVAIELSYKDKKYGEYFQVLKDDSAFKALKQESGITVTGLLGNSFFERYKYLIDFSEMIAYSKQ